ncbi:hypothetical protein GW17_00012517, partial [Ensete ventricosum]
AGSIERRGSRIKRQSHTEAAALSDGRTSAAVHWWPHRLQPRASDGDGRGDSKGKRS